MANAIRLSLSLKGTGGRAAGAQRAAERAEAGRVLAARLLWRRQGSAGYLKGISRVSWYLPPLPQGEVDQLREQMNDAAQAAHNATEVRPCRRTFLRSCCCMFVYIDAPFFCVLLHDEVQHSSVCYSVYY